MPRRTRRQSPAAAAGTAAGSCLDAVNDSPTFISPLSPMKPSSRSLTLSRSTPASPSESESLSRAVIARFCPGPSSYRRSCPPSGVASAQVVPSHRSSHPHPRGRHRLLGRLLRRREGVRRRFSLRSEWRKHRRRRGFELDRRRREHRAGDDDRRHGSREGERHGPLAPNELFAEGIAEDAGRPPALLPGQGRPADPQKFLRLETEIICVRADQPPRIGLRRQFREATFLDGENMADADPDRQPDLLGREPPALATLSQQPPDQRRALGINAGCGRRALLASPRSPSSQARG